MLVCVRVPRASQAEHRAAAVRLFLFFFFSPGITKPGGDKGATQFDNSTRSRAKTPTSRRLLSFLLDWLPLPSLPYQRIYFLSPSSCIPVFAHPSRRRDCGRPGRKNRRRSGGFTEANSRTINRVKLHSGEAAGFVK